MTAHFPGDEAETHQPDDLDDLVEQLKAGVPEVGLHEDNNTVLFDVEAADETMAEGAATITALRQQVAELEEAHNQIAFLSTNHGGWFDQPGQQFKEYRKLGDIARNAVASIRNRSNDHAD